MARYEAALHATPEDDRVLVHTDLGLHNVSIDAGTLMVRGVFDWESSCWADRHLDFRYLTFDLSHDALLDAAITAYEVATGRRLSRTRVHLYNAACAIGYLAFRDGIPADVVWCGRTLEEDLHWTRHAIARLDEQPTGEVRG
jgi:aminoglycoside phosphotransferase (APT) family kinase protein